MKKFPVILALFFGIISLSSKAQDAAYEKEAFQGYAGIEFGIRPFDYDNTADYSNVSITNTVPFSANIEYGVHKYISIGAYGGYFGKTWTYDNYRNEESETTIDVINVGVKGTLHGTNILNSSIPNLNINASKWDIYASFFAGLESINWEHTWKEDHLNDQPDSESDFRVHPVLGVRYMFTPGFGTFLEFGQGPYGFGRIGLSFNF